MDAAGEPEAPAGTVSPYAAGPDLVGSAGPGGPFGPWPGEDAGRPPRRPHHHALLIAAAAALAVASVVAMTGARRRPPPWSPWRSRADGASAHVVVRPRPAVVAGIKTFHTLAWLSIESCVAYVLCAGFAGRSDRRVGVAAAVVAGEALVLPAMGSGAR